MQNFSLQKFVPCSQKNVPYPQKLASQNFLFTSESVTEGHPDKICDQISDAILDAFLSKDPQARVACEVAVTTGMVLVMGEVTADCYVDIQAVVRDTIRGIGYTRDKVGQYGFDADSVAVLVVLNGQSPDIAMGVDRSLESKSKAGGIAGGVRGSVCADAGGTGSVDGSVTVKPAVVGVSTLATLATATGVTTTTNTSISTTSINTTDINTANNTDLGAGDQGMMFGYATNETEEYIPMPIYLAHKLTKRLAYVRKVGFLPYLRPDGKAQVTVEYRDGKPFRVDTIVISAQHSPDVTLEDLQRDIYENVIRPVMFDMNPIAARYYQAGHFFNYKTKVLINPIGRFVIGGPQGDSGLTGRKIIVDTYGGFARHGGGAFSGKDPTKVDRSAAYAARYVAKNVVKAKLASRCEIQLAYAIGVPFPVSVMVDTFGTGKAEERHIEAAILKVFDLSPSGIIETLDLRRPIYQKTASYGHFGRAIFPWEKTDKVEELKKAID